MKVVGERLKFLRESIGFSQMKLSKIFGVGQAGIFRYENSRTAAPFDVLVKYADYFDVSLDYIFGRTDVPQGKLYKGKPKIEFTYPEMDQFIEMCFDPKSKLNKRLKETLRQMMKEQMK